MKLSPLGDHTQEAMRHGRHDSMGQASTTAAGTDQGTAWPHINQQLREAVVHETGCGLAELWELSPQRIEDNRCHTEEIIERLFPGNPLLCCGKSEADFQMRLFQAWQGNLSRLRLIVPSPFSVIPSDKPTNQTSITVGPRRFLVVELHAGTVDDHAAIAVHLGGFAPLVCVVQSCRQSLAARFFVHRQSEDRVLKFFRHAISLGGNPSTWDYSQFACMPDGLDEHRKRQTVYFLNFRPLEARQ